MPYCVTCGNKVQATDVFCACCGGRQPVTPQPAPADFTSSMTPRTASVLCYIPIVGWIASILVLASTRFRDYRDVRFHAFQGLYLFVAWLIIEWVLSPMAHVRAMRAGPFDEIAGFLKMAMFGVWIFMLVKVSQDQMVKLPIVGELADRSVAEQR